MIIYDLDVGQDLLLPGNSHHCSIAKTGNIGVSIQILNQTVSSMD